LHVQVRAEAKAPADADVRKVTSVGGCSLFDFGRRTVLRSEKMYKLKLGCRVNTMFDL